MTTLRQIQANLLNSAKSCGPRTEEGKCASRANSLKHGLTGAGIVTAQDETDAIAQRLEAWRPSYEPATNEEEWTFREMITQSIRLDRCHVQESALRTNLALRASLCWDDDRRLSAEELGDKLAGKPARIAAALPQTRQGCEWMIERWKGLDAILEAGGDWTEAHRKLASDLLGIPTELRQSNDDFGSSPGASEARDLVRQEIEKLERRKAEALDALDEFERSATEQGLEVTISRPLSLLRRYEAACLRRFQSARNQLKLKAAERPASEGMSPSTTATQFATKIEVESEPAPDPSPTPISSPVRVMVPQPIVLPVSTGFARSMTASPSQGNRQQRRAARKLATAAR